MNEPIENVNRISLLLNLRGCLYFGTMATAGYSGGIPLIKKPGIKPGMKIRLIDTPSNYFELLEIDISDQLCTNKETPDLIHLFVKTYKALESSRKEMQPLLSKKSRDHYWASWYKKSAVRQAQGKLSTDITEDTIRNYALKNGLVDVKVCAISDEWSGLKLVVPLAKR